MESRSSTSTSRPQTSSSDGSMRDHSGQRQAPGQSTDITPNLLSGVPAGEVINAPTLIQFGARSVRARIDRSIGHLNHVAQKKIDEAKFTEMFQLMRLYGKGKTLSLKVILLIFRQNLDSSALHPSYPSRNGPFFSHCAMLEMTTSSTTTICIENCRVVLR